jgi:hypothetical protein
MQRTINSLLIILAMLAFSHAALAQSDADSDSDAKQPAAAKSQKSGPPPKSLAGTWAVNAPRIPWYNYSLTGDDPPMTAWAMEKFKENRPSFGPNAVEDPNDVAYRCLPNAVPRAYIGFQTTIQIVELPGRTLMFLGRNVRQIYTDGRPHPTDHHPLWMGHSVGKWDGDTFVIDTVDINDVNWLDRMGHPLSDKLHLIERFHRTDDKTLLLDITIDDPVAYTKVWNATQKVFRLRPNSRAGDGGICEDMFDGKAFGIHPILPPME